MGCKIFPSPPSIPANLELEVELSQGLQPMLVQRPGEMAGDFASRKQLWSVGIATVFLVSINSLCVGG